ASRRRALETEEQARRRRLATAGLSDQPERLLTADREADAVHRLDLARRARDEQTFRDGKVLRQILDADQGLDGGASNRQHEASCAGPTGKLGGYSRRQRSSA